MEDQLISLSKPQFLHLLNGDGTILPNCKDDSVCKVCSKMSHRTCSIKQNFVTRISFLSKILFSAHLPMTGWSY